MLNPAFSHDNPKEREPSEFVAISGRLDQVLAKILAETDLSHKLKNGIPVLPSRGEVVTAERIRRIMEEEGT